jgi:hypothetical protein
MAITQTICASFKLESWQAIHDFDSDTFKMALYNSATASLDADTTAYTTTGEITGTGYTAGGQALAITTDYPQLNSSNQVEVRFDSEAWTSATFSADGALIYNSSKSNRAVAVLSFGSLRAVSNGTFTVSFPTSLPATLRLL